MWLEQHAAAVQRCRRESAEAAVAAGLAVDTSAAMSDAAVAVVDRTVAEAAARSRVEGSGL